MKLYYVAHPLFSTGDAEENMVNANGLTSELQQLWQDVTFITPLDTIKPLVDDEFRSEEHYCKELAHCFNLLSRCDGIILAHGWENSSGCKAEYAFAEYLGKEIHHIDEFLPSLKEDFESE